jgi:hypothetical protein
MPQRSEVDTVAKVIKISTDHLSTWSDYVLWGYKSVPSTDGLYEVWYNPTHAQPRVDSPPSGYTLKDLATDVLTALKTSREAYERAGFTPLGYKINAFIVNETSQRRSVSGEIWLDRREMTSLAKLRGDASHEMFHAFQGKYFNIYNMSPRIWWIEGTPDYAAAKVAWNGALTLDTLDPNFFDDSLFLNLDTHAYQFNQFILYLVTKRNADFKVMWDTVANTPFRDTGVLAFQKYVSDLTGKPFASVWADFVDYSLFDPSTPMPRGLAKWGILKLKDGTPQASSSPLLIPTYAAQVVSVNSSPPAGKQARTVTVSATGLNPGPNLEIWQFQGTNNGAAVLKKVLVSDSDAWTANLSATDTVYAVVLNSGSATSNVTVTAATAPLPAVASLSPLSGESGDTVTISGTYFGANKGTVTFNGNTATVSAWGDTQIKTSVPSGATTGDLVVTDAFGNASNVTTFTVGAVCSTGTPLATSILSKLTKKTGMTFEFKGYNTYSTGTSCEASVFSTAGINDLNIYSTPVTTGVVWNGQNFSIKTQAFDNSYTNPVLAAEFTASGSVSSDGGTLVNATFAFKSYRYHASTGLSEVIKTMGFSASNLSYDGGTSVLGFTSPVGKNSACHVSGLNYDDVSGVVIGGSENKYLSTNFLRTDCSTRVRFNFN